MHLPLITVVTITYNLINNKRAKTFKQCVESVFHQTYQNIEHIVIDGASTDGSLDILKQYEDLGWITLYSEPDKGVYDAMNKGIAKAKGEYINFLNSDDFFHESRGVEDCITSLQQSGAVYSYADARILKRGGRTTLWKGELSNLLIGTHYCHQTMFVKTDLLRDIGGFDTSFSVSADSDLMIRLYAQGYQQVKVPTCFLTYRKGGYSASQRNQVRIDHSTSFFRHIGRRIGLTQGDCYQLWQLRFFQENSMEEQLDLICKVSIEFGLEYLHREFLVRRSKKMGSSGRKQFYLFGFIPIIERCRRGNKSAYFLFNLLRVFKIVDFNGKKKYFLFGFIPILKEHRFF